MKPRNYRKEYDEYHGKPKQRKHRSWRNMARGLMKLAGRVRKGDGKEVHHKRGIEAGNGRGNLKEMSRKANRKLGKP
tara:strand:+ start:186 stop:416 length:231 start_codon:yes stop_codon:yes gene_type:complete